MVLAGGRGERLRPYTEDRPKPMVEVSGAPILAHQLEWLKRGGVTDVIILCGYLHQVIMDYFGDGRDHGLRIQYSIEDEPLGRGGAFRMGLGLVPEGEGLVIGTNGDNLNTQPLQPMLESHRASNAMVTVMLTPLVSPYGIATLAESGQIIGFEEKPVLPHWLNAGVYIISKESFDLFPSKGDHEQSTFPQLAKEGKLWSFKSTAYWRAVDTVKDLTEASQEMASLQGTAS